MKCTPIALPGGGTAIVCGTRPKPKRCCSCENRAQFLCDWKVGDGKTCDRPVCSSCTTKPAEGKDLCAMHAATWQERQAAAR